MSALAGLRVLDLSSVLAGPLVARFLADFGAEVVKVEHPRSGDPSRAMGWQVGGASLWWATLNRSKLSITLDLSRDRGAELCRALARQCDVVVESFRPGTLERWGLGPDVLLSDNPRVVIVRVSGYGQTGPDAGRPGFGTLAEARSGWAARQGREGDPPQLPAAALADELAGAYGAIGALVALLGVQRGGPGQVVDVSLLEPLVALLGPLPALVARTGTEPPRMGNRLPFSAPRGAYRAADGRWLALSGTAQAAARRLLLAIGGPALADDPRFATPAARLTHADDLDAVITSWVGSRSRDAALEELLGADVAAAAVQTTSEVLVDPQLSARGALVDVRDEALGSVTMTAPLPQLSATPGAVRWTGQPAGSANAQIFGGWLGLPDEELAELAADGVI